MAKKSDKILGMRKVLNNLNKEVAAIEKRSLAGLLEAAILIRRDMSKVPPKIPVDTGTLRASWFITEFTHGKKFGIIMGFSANYAVFVHENMEATFKRPGSGPKFFEAALKRNEKKILEILADSAKIQ